MSGGFRTELTRLLAFTSEIQTRPRCVSVYLYGRRTDTFDPDGRA